MDRGMLAEWLRDIAQHIEEESPLIRDVSVDDALSDEGLAKRSSPSRSMRLVVSYRLKKTSAASPGTKIEEAVLRS